MWPWPRFPIKSFFQSQGRREVDDDLLSPNNCYQLRNSSTAPPDKAAVSIRTSLCLTHATRYSQCLQLDIQKRQNQLVLDGVPDDSRHLVALFIHKSNKITWKHERSTNLPERRRRHRLLFSETSRCLKKSPESEVRRHRKSSYQNLNQSQLIATKDLRGLMGFDSFVRRNWTKKRPLVFTEIDFLLRVQNNQPSASRSHTLVNLEITVWTTS